MITPNQLINSNAFLAIAVSDALQMLSDKSKKTYDELFEMFKHGHKGLTAEVSKMVSIAASVTAEAINSGER